MCNIQPKNSERGGRRRDALLKWKGKSFHQIQHNLPYPAGVIQKRPAAGPALLISYISFAIIFINSYLLLLNSIFIITVIDDGQSQNKPQPQIEILAITLASKSPKSGDDAPPFLEEEGGDANPMLQERSPLPA